MPGICAIRITALWAEFLERRAPRERDALVRAYLTLVRVTVYRLAKSAPASIDRDDLIAMGNLALVRAIDTWDPARGVAFETFALTPIRGAVLDALRARDPLGRTARQRLRAIQAAKETLEAQGREANVIAIAQLLGLPADDVADTLIDAERGNDVSLSEESQASLSCEDEAPARALDAERRAVLLVAIRRLPPRERVAVELYYFGEETGKTIGGILGVSDKRARQLLHQGVRRLRTMLAYQSNLFVEEESPRTKETTPRASAGARAEERYCPSR